MLNNILGMVLAEGRYAALRGERLLSARHELSERHVQPAPTGRTTRSTRTRLPTLSACTHTGRKTGR